MPSPVVTSYVELLRQRAAESPERPALCFLSPEGEITVELTYGEIDRRARAVAAVLAQRGEPGERAMLFLPPGPDFVAAFLGCLYAEVVAVPAYVPRRSRGADRALTLITNAEPRWVLTVEALESRMRKLFGELGETMEWLRVDAVESERAESFRGGRVAPETLAFLQYTSGSTSFPKGVKVSHGNLLHNQHMIRDAFGTSEQSTIIGWLPLYHDMGLIGNLLQPLFLGARAVLFSPMAFVQHPLRWLQAISRFQGNVSGGPNFGYDLCLQRISDDQLEAASLDLSTWQVAFSGAEPVREATLEAFAQRFETVGFRRQAFYPCYGLAESTLFVTGPRPYEGARTLGVESRELEQGRAVETPDGDVVGHRLVSCGFPRAGQTLRLVDPQTMESCPEGRVGEIWLAGESVAGGYWRLSEQTARDFGAHLGDEGPFLRTGDLGFLHRGELYVTGRLKDLIILRGRNVYPQDVELTVEGVDPALRPGCGAAFSVDLRDEERLVVVQEVDRRVPKERGEELLESIRRRLVDEHEVVPQEVVLVRFGSVPKTSSGKIRRGECRRLYLADQFPIFARSGSADPESAAAPELTPEVLQSLDPATARQALATHLLAQAARWARVDSTKVDPEAPLGDLGLDSVAAAGWGQAIEGDLGVRLPFVRLLDAPSAAELAEEVLTRLAEGKGSGLLPESRGEEVGAHPTSYGQRALWFDVQRSPEGRDLHLGAVGRIEGKLEPAALHRALQHLVRRHGALRTTFPREQGVPVQRVHTWLEPAFQEMEASGWERERLEQAWDEALRQNFDLETGPLVRVVLYRWSAERWFVQWTVHHLVADLRSFEILAGELDGLYGAELEGRDVELPSPELRYSDFCHWQETLLAGSEGERLEQYWHQGLGLEPEPLELPTDHARTSTGGRPAGLRSLELAPERLAEARRLGRARSATLFATLLTVWQGVLHRMTGRRDLAVGCPASGRTEPAFADLVGYFVNPLVLRSRIDGERAFGDLIEQRGKHLGEALDHQAYPFAKLAERAGERGTAESPPWFQVLFVWQRAWDPAREGLGAFALGLGGGKLPLGPLTLESVEWVPAEVQFDLTLTVAELEGRLVTALHYDRSLFEATTAARLLAHLEVLLGSAAAEPTRRLDELSLLRRSERHQLLREWNDTAGVGTESLTLPEQLLAPARRQPEATAVRRGALWLSYRILEDGAGALAAELTALGVGPEERVAVLCRRSEHLVLSLWAVLWAGGVYVPLDPDHPAERLARVFDTGFGAVLVEPGLRHVLPPVQCPVVELGIASRAAAEPLDRHREQLAYVIFTSGSTGEPKGVLVPDRGLDNILGAMEHTLGLGPEDVVSAMTTPSFDISIAELLLPLRSGARLELLDRDTALSGPRLGQALVQSRTTLFQATPSSWRMVLDSESPLPSGLRAISTGEALPESLAPRLVARVARLWDLYGPSEASIWATGEPVTAQRTVSIGRPVANTAVYVVDEGGVTVPVGAVGELWIAGVGLARGYLGRPAATAERFVPDAWGGAPGGRLYCTGDRARRRPEGRVHYLGRLDHQVKVRGFRIELGEIEKALEGHPVVRETVVVVREGEHGAAELVAYGVSAGGTWVASELRHHLSSHLPSYMVPAHFVELDALPLNPNGKVDRRALPAPTREGGEGEAPRGLVEETLAWIWAEALGQRPLDITGKGGIYRDADFFTLGGHSLLATQVLSRIHRDLGVELSVRDFFENPTLEALGLRVERARQEGQGGALTPIERAPRDQPLPLSFAQHRLWVLEQLEMGGAAYHIPVALELRGRLHLSALARALEEIVRRHAVLRTRFEMRDGQPHQVIDKAVSRHLGLWDLSGLDPEMRRREATRQETVWARRRFDLRSEWPLRVALARFGSEHHRLLLTVHHIAFDGWSGALFANELARIYEAFAAGRPSPLQELPIQYADFAFAQRQEGYPQHQLTWWKERLEGLPPLLELPTDRPRSAARTQRGARVSRLLRGAFEVGAGPQEGSLGGTPFMVFLAVFSLVLARHTGRQDLCVGTPVAHRQRPELEALVGFFVSTLALRTDLSGAPTFAELLDRVRRLTLEALGARDLPFEVLVEELRPERDLNHHPLFQVSLILHNQPAPELTLSGLEIRREEITNGFAKFDLTLILEPSAEGLLATLDYRRDLFDASSMVRLLNHFEILLGQALEAPDRQIDTLSFLGPAESWQLLGEWAAEEQEREPDLCLHHLIASWGEHREDGIAAVFGSSRLSYGGLATVAGRLAHRLRALGVGPEQSVGVAVEPSLEMVVAVVAILEAGGAYLPLSEQLPPERQAFMLQDAGVEVLLTGPRGQGPAGFEGQILALDGSLQGFGEEPAHALSPGARPENKAYVIYTSGTTGRPKGVMIEHRQIVHYVRAIVERLELEPGMDHALMLPIAVDSSLTSLFGSLGTGGCLHIFTFEQATDALQVADYFTSRSVDCLKIAPSHFDALRQAAGGERVFPRRRLVCGGEAATGALIDALRSAAYGERQIYNHYGPTETTVGVAAFRVDGQSVPAGSPRIPIGRPLPGVRAVVLDASLQPVPPGVSGQLFFGGEGVGRGYLGRPSLTAAAFLPDPTAPEAGARFYRTGDRARWTRQGFLEFLGRLDRQVKVRGFRIEPGEIEAALIRRPGIRQAVVTSSKEGSGVGRLVAYLVPEEGVELSAPELRAELMAELPDFMVPSALMPIQELPYLAHGKLDFGALPAPRSESLEQEVIAPEGRVEEQLVRIWQQVLGIERVSTGDNFFDLGGDSILSIQIVAQAARSGIRISPRLLFEARTLAEVAAGAVLEVAPETEQGLVVGDVPLTPIAHWFFEQDLEEPHHFNQAVMLEADRNLEVRHLESAFDAVVHHHDALRMRFHRGEEGWQQVGTAEVGGQIFLAVDLSGLGIDSARQQIGRLKEALHRSLDLGRGPLLRAVLFQLPEPEEADRLLTVIHHLVVDGVSWRVLLSDLAVVHGQLVAGQGVELPPKSTSFKRWAEELQRYANSPELAGEEALWNSLLSGDVAPLPKDFPGGGNTYGSARTVTVHLEPAETEALLREVPTAYRSSIDEVLLAALAYALGNTLGFSPLLIDLESHGREELVEGLDLSRTVGWFTAIYPLRLDWVPSGEIEGILGAVKEQLRKVLNGGTGYGLIRYLAAGGERAELASVRPQVKLNYLGQLDRALEDSAPFRPSEESSGTARSPRARRSHLFDLVARVSDHRFQLEWTYGTELHAEATVQNLAKAFLDALRGLIDQRGVADLDLSPVDFQLAGVSQEDLEGALAEFDFEVD